MSKMYEKLQKCVSVIREKTDFVPEVALILGSGLGEYAKNMDVKAEVPYSEIEGFPVSTVAGHDGRFLFGYVGKVPMVIMKGRVHYYEGYDMEEVVMPIRIMGLLGAKKVILTNAAGGVNLDFQPGDLMMITDHISTFVPSPLRGENIDELGTRFPDMSHVYAPELCEVVRKAAAKLNIPLREGIYIQCSGSELRDAGGDQSFPWNGGGCCRHEYSVRSHGSQPYGNEGVRNLMHHKYGCRNPRSAPGPQRSAGGR